MHLPHAFVLAIASLDPCMATACHSRHPLLAAAGFDLNAPASLQQTDTPEAPRLEGRDLLPFVTAVGERGKVGPHEALFWRMGNQWAVRKGDWKLLSQARANARQPGEVRLYNLREDIGETNDLAAKMPEKVSELRAAYDAWNAGNTDPLWRRSEGRNADGGGGGETSDDAAVPMPTQANYGAARGPYKVETSLGSWKDEARAREVPYKAYLPAGAPGGLPLVVISHGGGGSRDAQTFLAEHLASHGYAIIAAQHAGSDLAALRKDGRLPRALRGALQAMVNDQRNWSDRPRDISFLLDRVLAGGLGERVTIDRERIAVLGHSYGAYTAMAIGGMLVDLDGKPDTSFRDARVRAVLACSPQGVNQFGISEGAWSKIEVPVIMMTGTKDTGLKEGEDWTWRRQAFDALKARDSDGPFYLAILSEAGHMAFADKANALLDGMMGGRDPKFHGWIQQLSVAFLNTHLRNDDRARAWLVRRAIETDAERRVALELGGQLVGAPTQSLPADGAGRSQPQGGGVRGTGTVRGGN